MAYKAPAGGAIVNNQYFPGGSFIPRVMGKIRDVLKRRRASGHKVKLAREPGSPPPAPRLLFHHSPSSRRDGISARGLVASNDSHGPGSVPAVYLTNKIEPSRKSDIYAVDTSGLPLESDWYGGDHANEWWYAHFGDIPPHRLTRIYENGVRVYPKANLSRANELFPSATARPYNAPALSDRQIRNIERTHGVALTRKVTADGKVMANTEHIAQFLDGVMAKKLGHGEVVRKLQSPDVDDHEKLIHLVNHMTDEAGHARRKAGNSTNWYSSDIDKLDKAIGQTYGWHHTDPRVTLAKAVVALTSKDQQPVSNVMTAVRILDDAHKQSPTHPFHHLRPYNYAGYEKWLGQVREFVPPGVDIEHVGDATNAYQWYKNWGSIGERGYMTAPTVVDRKTDQPIGRRSGASLIPFPGFTKEQMVEGIKNKQYKVVQYTPAVGEDGRLKPKAWGPAASIAGHLGILKNLVAQLGESGAAKFLINSHDISELKKYKSTVDRGDTEKGEPLSGAYLFGPKFGPFFENMNNQHDKLTADKWWSRTWNRALGTLYDAANGEQTTPRSANERKMMRRAAAETAQRLNMSVAELQAVLWYYEQHLWRQFGATNDSQSFADAAEHLQRTRGSGSTGEQANRPRPDAVPF